MSRLTQVLLCAAVGVLVLAGAWPAAGAAGPSDPPSLLLPAQGASIAGGTAIVFSIQTFPSDSLLWVRVSHSASVDPADSCGRITADVTSKSLSVSSSDPSIYQAAPAHFTGDWMDTPGTYYWQAYRSTDTGCVASSVRSFTITPGPALTAPTLLSPAPGQKVMVGSPISFQIKTFAGDKLLSLRVSASPKEDSYGRIGNDIASGTFTATSDSSVFAATPVHFAGDWMDKLGTYYWQAYRTVFGAGSDGCIESEVRSFTLAYPPPKKLAVARLDGNFDLRLTVVTSKGVTNFRRGQTLSEQWAFTPGCSLGSCLTQVDTAYSSLGRWLIVLKRSGTVYRRTVKARAWRCLSTYYVVPFTINLRVTRGAWVGGQWRAVRVKGTVRAAFKGARGSTFTCRAGKFAAKLQGTIAQ